VEEMYTSVRLKGAVILRMLHGYVGDDHFRKGLSLYLKRYGFGSATTEEMWTCFEEVSSKQIGTFMNSWVSRRGYMITQNMSII
jgi:aminopeptidase N